MVLMVLTGWLDRREREALAYLIEENRLLRRQLGGKRLRLTDNDRRHIRQSVAEFVAHYHRERNHQGLQNRLIDGAAHREGRIRRQARLGGVLNYYERAA